MVGIVYYHPDNLRHRVLGEIFGRGGELEEGFVPLGYNEGSDTPWDPVSHLLSQYRYSHLVSPSSFQSGYVSLGTGQGRPTGHPRQVRPSSSSGTTTGNWLGRVFRHGGPPDPPRPCHTKHKTPHHHLPRDPPTSSFPTPKDLQVYPHCEVSTLTPTLYYRYVGIVRVESPTPQRTK